MFRWFRKNKKNVIVSTPYREYDVADKTPISAQPIFVKKENNMKKFIADYQNEMLYLMFLAIIAASAVIFYVARGPGLADRVNASNAELAKKEYCLETAYRLNVWASIDCPRKDHTLVLDQGWGVCKCAK